MSGDELETDLLEYVKYSNRLGYTLGEIADELARFGRLGLGWPVASAEQWLKVGELMVRDGRLVQSAGKITLPVETQVRQLELF